MSRKDVTYLILTIIILAVTGIIGFVFLAPKSTATSASKGASYEVIAPINSSLDGGRLSSVADPAKLKDFTVAIPLTGLGNASFFSPMQ